ncbi:TNF receptor-associated protein 1, mitochondrial [Chamberlinius hualienensis]
MAAYTRCMCWNMKRLILRYRNISAITCNHVAANYRYDVSGGQAAFSRPFCNTVTKWEFQKPATGQLRLFSSENQTKSDEDVDHTIIKNSETATSDGEKHDFQAETKMLLDIVAKSLYSEKEVFIRELISNGNDALERLRYATVTDSAMAGINRALEIHIATDKLTKQLIIQDTGIGMTKEELKSNLGTIARSGSKAFLKEAQEKNMPVTSIIGQFGVGFYSAFMVADKVEVYTASLTDNKGYKWTSDGSGSYEIQEASGVESGTKIVVHLKQDCLQFADEDVIKDVIKKYSNFVGNPIFLNGKRVNTIQALWLMEPKEVSDDMHDEFYRFISKSYDRPRYWLHYKTDAPLNIRCLLYFPEGKPGLFEMSRDPSEAGVALYSRKVLIKNKTENLVPKWLRFLKGVVDSEDIPLNLSRELLQDSVLIRRLRTVLTNRVLRFLVDQHRKDVEKYKQFFKDYGIFLKEGIISDTEQLEKEEISKLMLYESSHRPEGEKVTLPEYCGRMKENQKDIYYLAAPSRHLAETSPYYEALKQKEVEVLFCYEPYDELVLLQLRQFDRKPLISVEKEMFRDKEDIKLEDTEGGLSSDEAKQLVDWLKMTLKQKVKTVKVTKRLTTHPCAVTVEEMGAARHFVRTQFQSISEDQRYKLLDPVLEVNLSHPIMKKLASLRTDNPKLAELIADQIMDSAMVVAGLIDDPRTMVGRMNELLALTLDKH